MRVFDALKARILSLELAPGVSLDEARIVDTYGVSRTPVREAMIRLESEGLIILLPNRGAHVAPLDLARIKAYLEGIDLIQRAVTRWAAVRRSSEQLAVVSERAQRFEQAVAELDSNQLVISNHDFHVAIAKASGNSLVAEAYCRFLAEGLRIARFTLNPRYYSSPNEYGAFLDRVVLEHRSMVRALEMHDPDLAERTAAEHTEHTRARFVGYLYDSLAPSVGVDRPLEFASASKPGAPAIGRRKAGTA